MAADKWLEAELAELNEAEQIIQQTMSDFAPMTNGDITKGMNIEQYQIYSEWTELLSECADVDRI